MKSRPLLCALLFGTPLAAVAACTPGNTSASAPGSDSGGFVLGSPSEGGSLAPSSGDSGVATDASSSPSADAQSSSPSTAATFLTVDTRQYLSDGVGGNLTAASNAAGPTETFALTDLLGRPLASGDPVALASGASYLSAADGGGGALTFSATSAGSDETFFLVLADGGAGPVASGDQVALKTKGTGNYVSAINGGGGQVLANAPWDRGWETFILGLPASGASDAGTSDSGSGSGGDAGSPDAGPGSTLLGFLQGISGIKTVAGEHNRESDQGNFIQAMDDVTGHYPALWGGDFLYESDQIANRPAMIAYLEQGYRSGSIISLMYHACPPTGPESCGWNGTGGVLSSLTDAQWSDLTTDGGTLNGVWKTRLDAIAPFFQQLQAAGMGALFRPHHEMNQGVFWWGGRPGPTGTAALYRVTHDYLVNKWGLTNIVWVWSMQDIFDSATNSYDFDAYNPGDAYWDVMSLDFYDGAGYTTAKYTAMLAEAGSKPIAIGECQVLPTPAELAAQPRWVYFMGWSELIQQNDTNAQITATYTAPGVLTQDRMPGW